MRSRTPLLVLVLLWAAAAPPSGQGRLRPPAFVTCDRNALTSFTGTVTALERGRDATTIRMDTDEDTRERFVLRHAGAPVEPLFFVAGRPFTAADWPALVRDGTLRAGVRATVWVCAAEANPKVEWSPPTAGPR